MKPQLRRLLRLEPLEDRRLLAALPTLASLSVPSSSAVAGQPVMLTATVIVAPPHAGTPTGGTVTFDDGSTVLGTAPLTAGKAQLTTSALVLGANLLTASYGGDGVNYLGSAVAAGTGSIVTTTVGSGLAAADGGSASASVTPATTATSLSLSAGNPTYGGTFSMWATLTASGLPVVNRTVTFSLHGTTVGTGTTDSSGAAMLTSVGLGSIGAGTHSSYLGVSFAGDTTYSASSATAALTVNKATLTIGPSNVSRRYGSASPTFSVNYGGFVNGDTAATAFTGSLSYQCSAGISSGVGTYPYWVYQGTLAAANYLISISVSPAYLTITPAPLTVMANNASRAYGVANPTFTASYSGFVNGDTFSSSIWGNPSLTTVATSTSPAGTYTIFAGIGSLTAIWGNYTFQFANGTLTVTAPTTIAVTASPATIISGQSVTLAATVTALPPAGGVPNAGTVTFSDNGVTLGTAPVGSGAASLTTSALAVGSHLITAVYSGGSSFFQSSSSTAGPNMIITSAAGSFNVGDNGSPSGAHLNTPYATVTDAAGDLFIADTGDNQVREVLASTGQVVTIAGWGAAGAGWGAGFSGDGGPATAAEINSPRGLALDSSGNLYFADYANNRVRKVNLSTGKISTVVGDGTAGFGGDGGPATAAMLSGPTGLAFDAAGDLLVVDSGNSRVRIVNAGSGVISTLAGSAVGDGSPATNAPLNAPYGVAEDAAGDLFIADSSDNRIREVVAATGQFVTVAGSGTAGYAGDGGQATAAGLDDPQNLVLDGAGNLYVADTSNNRIREINLGSGIITALAGDGTAGFSGDGQAATAAELSSPGGLVLDGLGDLLISDSSNNRIREVNLSTGVISTVAGTGTGGFSGDGTAATAAELNDPASLAVDSSGDLYIVDRNNYRVREVSLATGTITTAAGNGNFSNSGDGGPATAASFLFPSGVAVDAAGNLYISDDWADCVRVVNASTGVISTLAGNGFGNYSGDGGPASAAQLNSPEGLAIDGAGSLLIADASNNRVRSIDLSSQLIGTVAGTGGAKYGGDGGRATLAVLNAPAAVAVDAAGDVFIADTSNNRVREINAATGVITTAVGTGAAAFGGDGGPVSAAKLTSPAGVAVDSSGNLFIADYGNFRIREVNAATGTIATVAGNGTYGLSVDGTVATAGPLAGPRGLSLDAAGHLDFADATAGRIRQINLASGLIRTLAGGSVGDGLPATAAVLNNPGGMVADAAGDLLIADTADNRVREINAATGVISTVAGDGLPGFSGDGGPATAAYLSGPRGLALDLTGDLFIADTGNNRIREVNLHTGVITTVAGNGSYYFSSYPLSSLGDGGPATAAELSEPYGVAVDYAGNLYIADTYDNRIRKVSVATGIITTVAGNGNSGFSGDGRAATAAALARPEGLALDAAGNIDIADTYDLCIRQVNAVTGIITTVAGGFFNFGSGGDGGPATAATMSFPSTVAVDTAGDLYIADTDDNCVRMVTASTGVINTVAGIGLPVFGGDGGPASAAYLDVPYGVAVDALGNLFIADSYDNRVRRVPSGNAQVTVDNITTATTLGLSAVSAAYDGSITLSATLLARGAPAPNETISFSVNGTTMGAAITNASGVATLGNISAAGYAAGTYNSYLGASFAGDSNYSASSATANLTVYSVIASRDLFYANSSYNGDSDTASAADDNAIDTSKSALLPGQTATYANYTDSTQGLNGIMVDVAGLPNPAGLTVADFQFLVGNDSTPGDWTTLGTAPSVAVRVGAGTGGSDRVELIWPDNTIHNQWLQVTVLADANTGLAANDVFYFGSEPGAVQGAGYASFDDIFAVYRAIGNTPNVTAGTVADVNHDGMITFDDIFAVYRAIGGAELNMITAPATPADLPAAMPATGTAGSPLTAAPAAATTAVTSMAPAAATTPVAASLAEPAAPAAAIQSAAGIQPAAVVETAAAVHPWAVATCNPPQAVIEPEPWETAARSAASDVTVRPTPPEAAPVPAAITVAPPPKALQSSTASPADPSLVFAPSLAASAVPRPLPLRWAAQPFLPFDLVLARTQDWSWAELLPESPDDAVL